MPLDLGSFPILRITADSTTPQEIAVYDGFLIALTPEAAAALPTGIDTLTVEGITLPGYQRTKDGQLQWVMTPLPDPNVAMLNTLPRPAGWASPDAKGVWASIGLILLEKGVSGEELRAGFPALFNAARAEIQAEG